MTVYDLVQVACLALPALVFVAEGVKFLFFHGRIDEAIPEDVEARVDVRASYATTRFLFAGWFIWCALSVERVALGIVTAFVLMALVTSFRALAVALESAPAPKNRRAAWAEGLMTLPYGILAAINLYQGIPISL